MATIDTLKNVSLGIFHGFWDSIRGMTLVLHIDEEIHKLNAEKEAQKQRRILERQRRMRRSPSPAPSSASAMDREERESSETSQQRENPDERSIESIRRKSQPAEPKVQGEKKVAKQVLKCCLLNGGFTWLSIIFFEQLLLPVLKFVLTQCYGENSQDLNMIWGWLQSILSIIFGMMWVLPIFLLSKIVSSLWFADIANAAYMVRKGRPQLIPSISKLVADFLFSLVVQALFLVQSMLVNLFPVHFIGSFLCFVHLCLLYSLYSFEYKWFNMGWELHRRLSYIENNWPYFLGFGLPLTILTNMSSSIIVSSCIFSIFFPLFILSGNEAKPLVGTTETPLRLFSPVIYFSNLFFSRPEARPQRVVQANTMAAQQQRQQLLFQQQLQEHNLRQQSEFQEQPLEPQTGRFQKPPQTTSRRPTHKDSSPLKAPAATPESERYSGGKRPLIPTIVPGAPGAPSAAGSSVHRS